MFKRKKAHIAIFFFFFWLPHCFLNYITKKVENLILNLFCLSYFNNNKQFSTAALFGETICCKHHINTVQKLKGQQEV